MKNLIISATLLMVMASCGHHGKKSCCSDKECSKKSCQLKKSDCDKEKCKTEKK